MIGSAPGQISFETGNCPPGYSRPGPMYDCRPNTSGQTYLQEDLARTAAHYVDDSSTQGQSTQGQSTSGAITGAPYQMPVVQGVAATSGGIGGIDTTTLLIIGVLLIFVMKR